MHDTVDLGRGHRAALLWYEGTDRDTGVPMGLVETHGGCRTYICWVGEQGWTLGSLRPLSVEPAIACPTCGQVGWIHQGRYLPVTPSAQRPCAPPSARESGPPTEGRTS